MNIISGTCVRANTSLSSLTTNKRATGNKQWTNALSKLGEIKLHTKTKCCISGAHVKYIGWTMPSYPSVATAPTVAGEKIRLEGGEESLWLGLHSSINCCKKIWNDNKVNQVNLWHNTEEIKGSHKIQNLVGIGLTDTFYQVVLSESIFPFGSFILWIVKIHQILTWVYCSHSVLKKGQCDMKYMK